MNRAGPGPARPLSSLTAHFLNEFKEANLGLLHKIVTDNEIVASNFQRDFFISSGVIVFFCEDRFLLLLHTFLRIRNSRTLNIFKI